MIVLIIFFQHVQGLEQTANELQQKVITLQQEKETMETKLKHHGTLEEREQMEVMEAKVLLGFCHQSPTSVLLSIFLDLPS